MEKLELMILITFHYHHRHNDLLNERYVISMVPTRIFTEINEYYYFYYTC